ncbi:MAG: hypothetical protein ACJAZS_000675 [Alteromonas naphthalenivorans]|jgi:hypothetical protein
MKCRIYVLALLLLHSCTYTEDVSGKSVFVDFENFELYSTTGYTLVAHQQHEKGHILNKPELSAVIFGGKTTSGAQDELNKYFLFDGKKELIVKEAIPATANTDAAQELSQDISTGDFNLQTVADNYASRIWFKPVQRRLGMALSLRIPFCDKYWVNIDAPFEHLKQDLDLQEERTSTESTVAAVTKFTDSTTLVTSMYEAFRQTGLNYGRINGAQTKNGLADLTIRIGRNAYNREDFFVSQHFGIVIPTGNRRTAEYMWEPIVGNGHHAGLDWGNTTHICMHEADRCNWWITNAISGRYLFENTQKRSLDLHNGPWTRYLAMYKNTAARTSDARNFGINSMTKDVKVSPGVSFGISTQLSMMAKNWNMNVGVINRFRQAEEVTLAESWVQGPQIATIGTVATAGTGEVIPSRKMGRALDYTNLIAGGAAPTDYFIKESDINLNSAAHTNVFASTIHASVAYYRDAAWSQNYELGGSYDTSRQNTAIDRWSIYTKLLISF